MLREGRDEEGAVEDVGGSAKVTDLEDSPEEDGGDVDSPEEDVGEEEEESDSPAEVVGEDAGSSEGLDLGGRGGLGGGS